MASSSTKSDDNEPQEDDELTEQYDMDNKMNSTTNGLAPTAKSGKHGGPNLRDRFKQAKTRLFADRHIQIHALLLLIILLLGILLIYVSCKLLAIALREPDPVCETSACLSASARVLSSVNNSRDPCENFFHFSCDTWMQSHPLREDQGFFSVEQQVQNEIYDDIRRYLDRVLPTLPHNDPHLKAKRFYDSCMALEDVDLLSFNNFKHEIQSVGGWNLLPGSWSGSWQHGTALERLQVIYGVEPFFRIEVGADDLDPHLPYIIKIYPSGLGLPKNYYFDHRHKKAAEAYKQYMSESVKIFDGTKLDSSQFAENTFSYEKRIAEITPDKTDYLRPSSMFKRRYSIRELKLIAPSIKWSDILQKYFEKARLSDNTRVLLAFETYFRNISNIISTTDMRGLNDYLIWKMIHAYSPYLGREFRINHQNFQQALYGMQISNFLDDENRWHFCIGTVSKYMGYALSSLYIQNRKAEVANVTTTSKTEIVNVIRETILKNANFFPWSGNDDAQRLINMKLKRMEILIGQPIFVQQTNFADYYSEFMTQIKFMQNILEAIAHRHKKMEMLFSSEKKTDHAWPLLPHEVGVKYDYAGNKLYIPNAMLRVPFYNSREPYSMQFGALGFQIASSMLKAFDLTGLQYALPDGRLTTNRSSVAQSNAFDSALNCLREDFSALPLKANETLSQTYIDVGALKVAWLAHRSFVTSQGNQAFLLPILPFTADQLFFLSFGQTMCGNTRPEVLEFFSETSNQLPNAMRINTVLRHSQIFNDAFKCPSALRRTQCNLWN